MRENFLRTRTVAANAFLVSSIYKIGTLKSELFQFLDQSKDEFLLKDSSEICSALSVTLKNIICMRVNLCSKYCSTS